MANNLKRLKINERDYIWQFRTARIVLDQYSRENKKTKKVVYEEIAESCIIGSDAVKNWFLGKNGPGEPEYVLKIAEYFKKDIEIFLIDLEKERCEMEESVMKIIDYDRKTNLGTTLKFMARINRLAEDSKKGIMGFNEFVGHHKYRSYDLHDLLNPDYDGEFYPGIIYIDEEGPNYRKVIADMCFDFQHRDIVSTYDEVLRNETGENIDVFVDFGIDDKPYVEISNKDDENFLIYIENGTWCWDGV